MPSHYTDVEKLLLQRWPDVRALMAAYQELQNSMEEMLQDVGEALQRWADERAYSFETDARGAEYRIWKAEWANRRNDPGVWFTVGGFVPEGYRKCKSVNPYIWVDVALENLRVKSSLHGEFVRELNAALGDGLKEWQNLDVNDSQPLGRYLEDYDDSQRLQWMMSPASLTEFVKGAFEQLLPLQDPIDKALGSIRQRA